MNIQVRRRQEDRASRAAAGVADTLKVTGIVEFAHRSDKRIASNLVKGKVSELMAGSRAALDARRARLAALLEAEKSVFEREVAASFETPEQVKARLFAFARQLKEDRENKRRNLADELEERRFRLASDVLRARASQIITEEVSLDRVVQLQVSFNKNKEL